MTFVADFASDNSLISCVGRRKSLVLTKSEVMAETESKKNRGVGDVQVTLVLSNAWEQYPQSETR
jgi:hypothetical protein